MGQVTNSYSFEQMKTLTASSPSDIAQLLCFDLTMNDQPKKYCKRYKVEAMPGLESIIDNISITMHALPGAQTCWKDMMEVRTSGMISYIGIYHYFIFLVILIGDRTVIHNIKKALYRRGSPVVSPSGEVHEVITDCTIKDNILV